MKPHLGQAPQDPGPQLQEGGGWGGQRQAGLPMRGPRLTGVLVGQGDEGAGDVPPPVETHHLGLHIPVGRLQQQGRVTQEAGPRAPELRGSRTSAGRETHRPEPPGLAPWPSLCARAPPQQAPCHHLCWEPGLPSPSLQLSLPGATTQLAPGHRKGQL